jgi:hypothetical protein
MFSPGMKNNDVFVTTVSKMNREKKSFSKKREII